MPKKPIIDELATRETSMWLVANQYAKLMVPDDTVLEIKGRDYKVYRETLRDDQCANSFAQRRLAVVSKEWNVDPASEDPQDVAAADALKENISSLDWDKITDLMLYARWYGHSIAECMYAIENGRIVLNDIKVRDRSRFAYDIDDKVYLQRLNGRFELMPDRKFWVIRTGADHDDSPYGLGLAHYCYWPAYFKRSGIRFWLTFAEKFGTPTAAGKVPAGMISNESLRQQCLEALNSIASETAVLIPEGMEVDLLEAARGGANTYEELVSYMDAAIAKIIVGQTASSQGTPGKLGNEELQSDVRLELVKSDADLICSSFNRQVSKWLTEWNFPSARPPKIWRKVEPEEDTLAKAERDTKIFSLGYTPTLDYITDTYGEGWEEKEQPPQLLQPPGPLQPPPEDADADFAERVVDDQQAIVKVAQAMAQDYEALIGKRVQSLLDMADTTKDYQTFAKRIREMMEEGAPPETQQAIERATVAAKLLGAFRQQR